MTTEKKKASKLNKSRTLERENSVWQMRLQGATYERISTELKIPYTSVHNALERLHKRYAKFNIDIVDKTKKEQIAQLNHIADEAYQAWEKSKGKKAVQKLKSRVRGEITTPYEAVQEVSESHGDAQYLAIYLKAKKDLREIIGIDFVTKGEITVKTIGDVSIKGEVAQLQLTSDTQDHQTASEIYKELIKKF